MSLENARKFMALGMAAELAKEVSDALDSAGASVAWDDVTGKPATFAATPASVTAAVAAKAQIAALTNLTGTVGTANDAMTAIAALSASTLATDFATQKTSLDAVITAMNTQITAINNNLADLQAKANAQIAALKA